jgi:four helix bundle protein
MNNLSEITQVFNFENLRIYQDVLIWINEAYEASDHWPKHEQFGLTSQWRRAVTSIALNIAEGSSRTSKDFSHFLSTARRSCFECAAIITIAHHRGYLTQDEFTYHTAKCKRIARTLTALRNSITK